MTDLVDLERRLLGAFLLNNRLISKVMFLHADDFTEPSHRRIWTAIQALILKGQIANPVTVKKWLEDHDDLRIIGGPQYLACLASSNATNDTDTLVDEWITARPHTQGDWWAWYRAYLSSDEWKAKRRKVLDRCGRLCEGCRDAPVTQVHHLTYDHVGDELLYELVGLCDVCHERAHQR